MFYQLPPVGNRVWLGGTGNNGIQLDRQFNPCTPRFFSSGTAALAASVAACVKRKDVADPQVILPAYGCPDLVSAVEFAGARPVLVDLEAERPWMDLEQVTARLSDNTVAVIAASLCGIPERLADLRRLLKPAGVYLVEDSAQLFPGRTEDINWQGDFVVLSFGRGKPVNLLGGGAVLCADEALLSLLPELPAPPSGTLARIAYPLKAFLYNRLLSPRVYWSIKYLPFLHVGETCYHRLESIGPLDAPRRAYLERNCVHYLEQASGNRQLYGELCASLADERVIDLPGACEVPAGSHLLRYPLLLQPPLRQQVHAQLTAAGLGSSLMYPVTLPNIPGLETLLAGQGPFPAAEDFARRLLTLPTHAQLRRADRQEIITRLRAACG